MAEPTTIQEAMGLHRPTVHALAKAFGPDVVQQMVDDLMEEVVLIVPRLRPRGLSDDDIRHIHHVWGPERLDGKPSPEPRRATETIFDGPEHIIPMAEVVFVERHTSIAGAFRAILKGTTWNAEVGDYNNAAYVPPGEAPSFLEAWTRYRSEVDPVVQGPGEVPVPLADPMAFQNALEMAFGHAAHVQVSFHNAGTKAEHVDGLASQALMLLQGTRLEHQRGEIAWWTKVERGDIRFVVYGEGPVPDGWGEAEKKEA
ncbi:MAG: hypothetical protein ACYC5Y_04980 [Symbiobacteriia bacterium]